MTSNKLRLIVLTHGGEHNVRIIERILKLTCAEVSGIFIETETTRNYSLSEKVKRSIRYNGYVGTLIRVMGKFVIRVRKVSEPSQNNSERLSEIAAFHGVPVHLVPNYHLPASVELMRVAKPDLGVVLGTNILKEAVFSIPRLGSINLHQGLAPYYRGGPSVFWELYNGESEVGLTVHFVAAQVDTGHIIAQESVPLIYDFRHGLNYDAFIVEYREKLSSRAVELVPQAIQMLAEGTATPFPQNTLLGKRYRLPVKKDKDELRRRLRERMRLEGSVTAGKLA